MKLKSECGEKLSHIKETTSQEIALLQEELRQQQLIINEKFVLQMQKFSRDADFAVSFAEG